MNVFLSLSLVFVAIAFAILTEECFGFQQLHQQPRQHQQQTTSLQMGLFDGFIKSMESGYAGGDDSQYSKMKASEDVKREALQQKKRDERMKRGFSNFKDYNPKTQKTFAKLKYDNSDEPKKEDTVSKWAKEAQAKKKASGFKFPWDK